MMTRVSKFVILILWLNVVSSRNRILRTIAFLLIIMGIKSHFCHFLMTEKTINFMPVMLHVVLVESQKSQNEFIPA